MEENTRKAVFSSKKMDWGTPQELFDKLNSEFNFDLDPCADERNHKCSSYYTKETDGLKWSWGGHRVFCNPPYGQEISKWVKKCYQEGQKPNTTVVMLIPSRTDTKYFHDYIWHKSEVRFMKGRVKFEGAKFGAPFPSMVVIYRGPEES